MKTGTEQKKEEGARFVRYFGPLLDALRSLGGSGTPDEVVERLRKTVEVVRELGSTSSRVINLVRFNRIPAPAKDVSGDYTWSDRDVEAAAVRAQNASRFNPPVRFFTYPVVNALGPLLSALKRCSLPPNVLDAIAAF